MKKILVAGSLALASMNAMADEERGFYFTAGFGESQYDISKEELDDVASAAFQGAGAIVLDSDSSFDDKGDTWVVSGGYRFSRYIAVEAGYVDLGSAKYRASGPVLIPGLGVLDANLGVDISAKGPMAAATAFVPLGEKFDLHGHLGIIITKMEFDIGVQLDDIAVSESVSDDSADAFAGVGAAFHVTKNFALSLDYSLFQDVGGEDSGEGDIDSLRLSVQFRL